MSYKKLLLAGIAFLTLATFSLVTQPAAALFDDAKGDACSGIQGTSSGGACTTGGTSLNDVISAGINILSVIVGLVAVVMIIVGGFKYITSNGDSGAMQSAKHTIIYAIIGLIVVAFAQFIVQFVLEKSTTKPPATPSTGATP
jgi:hypothetical protein